MDEEMVLLRESLESILLADDTFPARFYEILFERHPQLRPLFHRNSAGAQRKMFAQKLVAIVDHIEDPSWMSREVGALARSHADYGVTPEMYPWVAEALLDTIAEGLGAEFTERHRRAWLRAWERLAAAIVATPA